MVEGVVRRRSGGCSRWCRVSEGRSRGNWGGKSRSDSPLVIIGIRV